MTNRPNFRNPKNGNPTAREGAGGRARKGGISPIERKLMALEATVRKKLYAKYGELINQASKAELMEIIRIEFGDNPIAAILDKPDPLGNALCHAYGNPISRWSY